MKFHQHVLQMLSEDMKMGNMPWEKVHNDN